MADKKEKKEKKIKTDSGANIPKLAFYVLVGTVFLSLLTFVFALAGFIFFPPVTSMAAALAAALAGMGFYRLYLFASGTRSVPAARVFVGLSALLVGYIHICVVMSAVEWQRVQGMDELTVAEALTSFSVLIIAAFQEYFFRPALLWEYYLFYGGGWAATMLIAPLAMLGFSQISVGGVGKRLDASLQGEYEDDEPPAEGADNEKTKAKGDKTT